VTFFGSLKSIHLAYKHNYGEVIEEELGDAKNSSFCVADSVSDRLLSSSLAHQAPLWIHQVNDATRMSFSLGFCCYKDSDNFGTIFWVKYVIGITLKEDIL
jgi:hypothetical protein